MRGHDMTQDNYALAVEQAITEQDLRPIMDALTAEHIPFTVEQTGGFCMVGFTELPNGELITWNANSVFMYASAWAYSQDSQPWREIYDLNPATVAQTVADMVYDGVRIHDDLVQLWHDMDADTYARDFHLRGETAHRLQRPYTLRESIADNYGSISDNIPCAQDYADTIEIQHREMFPECYA